MNYDSISDIVKVPQGSHLGFCAGYQLRRPKSDVEAEANRGTHQARQDWHRLIGPIDTFANANPYHGSFGALTVPFTMKDRAAIVSYLFEYSFLYDDILESANEAIAMDPKSDGLVLSDPGSVMGATQIQDALIYELLAVDKPCAERILEMWKKWVVTTRGLKKKTIYTTLDEYVQIRIWDAGVHYMFAIMLWGIGVYLDDEEWDAIQKTVMPGFAAIVLANDYISFDYELAEHKKSVATSGDLSFTNAVWLCMQTSNMGQEEAKGLVQVKTMFYEAEYIAQKAAFLTAERRPDKIRFALDGVSQMIIGNVAWSMTCPRYHPERRYDANAGVENDFLEGPVPSVEDVRAACLRVRS